MWLVGISELPDFHVMTQLQSKQSLSSYHKHKWFHICWYNFLTVCVFELWIQFLEHSWMQLDEVGWYNQWYRSILFKRYKVFHMLFKIQFCLTNSPAFLPFLSVILSLSHVFVGIMVERMI